jgi:hypothetical protein
MFTMNDIVHATDKDVLCLNSILVLDLLYPSSSGIELIHPGKAQCNALVTYLDVR